MNKLFITGFIILLLLPFASSQVYIIEDQREESGSGVTGSGQEYENYYIVNDIGEESSFNITGFSGSHYEVHIE